METEKVSEYKIGPFEYDEAVGLIKKYALALTNLGLHKRFTISPSPHPVKEVEHGNNGRGKGRRHFYYQVVLVDHCPDEPKPAGLTTLKIRTAEAAGYTPPKTKYYEAFGQRMSLNQWAKATGVSRPTLKSRIDAGLTMEEAVTQIALKKAS